MRSRASSPRGLLGALINSLTLVGMVGVMFYINWRFTLIALSVAPRAVRWWCFTTRGASRRPPREVRKKEGEIVSVIQEVLTSMRVVKAFAREDYEQRRLEEESLESVEIALRARSLKAKLVSAGGDHRGGRHQPGAVVWSAHGAGRRAFCRVR